jgi:hypothetical protein
MTRRSRLDRPLEIQAVAAHRVAVGCLVAWTRKKRAILDAGGLCARNGQPVKDLADDRRGPIQTGTEAPPQLPGARGPRAAGSHAPARARAQAPLGAAWARRNKLVSGLLRTRHERSRDRAARAGAGPHNAHVPQDAPESQQPRRRAPRLLLRAVPRPRGGGWTVGARRPHVGSPRTRERPRVASARCGCRAPA